MDLNKCYELINGNYEEALSRLMKEERITKYLKKFVDTKDYAAFFEAKDAQDWETAFRAVHSIKGMCLNLSITKLAEASSELCETMRHGAPTVDIEPLVATFKEEYEKVNEVLKTL